VGAGLVGAAEETDAAGLDEIGNGGGGLGGIAAATGDGEDEIAEGKL